MSQAEWSQGIGESQQAIESLEGELWVSHFLRSPNPVLVQCGIFIAGHIDRRSEGEFEKIPRMDPSQLTPLQIFEAESLAKFFSKHSNQVLFSLSEYVEEWFHD